MYRSRNCKKLQEDYESFDRYGQSFRFKLPGGKLHYKTFSGATFTYLIWILIAIYGGLQLYRLKVFRETIVTSSVKDSYYTFEDVFPDEIEDL